MDGVIRFLLRHLDSRNLKNWKNNHPIERPVLGRRLLEVYARAAGHKLGRRIRERLVVIMKSKA